MVTNLWYKARMLARQPQRIIKTQKTIIRIICMLVEGGCRTGLTVSVTGVTISILPSHILERSVKLSSIYNTSIMKQLNATLQQSTHLSI